MKKYLAILLLIESMCCGLFSQAVKNNIVRGFYTDLNMMHKDRYFVLDPKTCVNNIADTAISNIITKIGKDGGTIVIPDKMFYLNSSIVITNPCVSIQGMGCNSGFYYYNNDKPAIHMLRQECFIKNIKIIGNSYPDSVGIKIGQYYPNQQWGGSSCFYFFLENVSIHYFYTGINLEQCWIGTIRDSKVNACDVGMLFGKGFVNAVKVSGGEYTGNTGIKFQQDSHNHLGNTISTTIEGCSNYGILMESKALGNRVRDCYFELNTKGDILINNKYACGNIINGNYFLKSVPSIRIINAIDTFISENTLINNTPFIIEQEALRTKIGPNCHDNGWSGDSLNPKFEINNKSSSTILIGY